MTAFNPFFQHVFLCGIKMKDGWMRNLIYLSLYEWCEKLIHCVFCDCFMLFPQMFAIFMKYIYIHTVTIWYWIDASSAQNCERLLLAGPGILKVYTSTASFYSDEMKRKLLHLIESSYYNRVLQIHAVFHLNVYSFTTLLLNFPLNQGLIP